MALASMSIRCRRGMGSRTLRIDTSDRSSQESDTDTDVWYWVPENTAHVDSQQSVRAIRHLHQMDVEFKCELQRLKSELGGDVSKGMCDLLRRKYADRLFAFRLESCLAHRDAADGKPTVFAVT